MKRQKDILLRSLGVLLLILAGSFMIGVLASYPNANCNSQLQKNCQAFLIAGQIQYIANSIFGFVLTVLPLFFSLVIFVTWYSRDKKYDVQRRFQKRLQSVAIGALVISLFTTVNSFTVLFSSNKSLFDILFRGGISFLGTLFGFCSYIGIPILYLLFTIKFMQLANDEDKTKITNY